MDFSNQYEQCQEVNMNINLMLVQQSTRDKYVDVITFTSIYDNQNMFICRSHPCSSVIFGKQVFISETVTVVRELRTIFDFFDRK